MSSLPAAFEIPESVQWAHPLVQEWFVERFGTPTEPQEQGWPHILARRDTLISAPTGSGKTFAAFLACLDALIRKALAGDLQDRTEVLYISPLKALGNDIQKNLEAPLGEIMQRAAAAGLLMPAIRTMVRTGDTPPAERRSMLKRPPHILVTTPESLYILLTAEKSRAVLRDVHTVIVDEIHAIADDKRGAHLALSLERLEHLTATSPLRIGLSATQKPIELVASFLCGSARPLPVIVDVGHKRQLDLAIEVPAMELGPVASNELWDGLYDRICQLVGEHRSTLVFVNTRRLAERVAHNLGERLGEDCVAAHHGSLSRKLRLDAEQKLKAGEVKALVATASLELGIDIGFVDLVCHIGSPRSIAVTLQRIGRAGHWRGAIPKGRVFATTRDELLECAALVQAINHGDLDRLVIPVQPMDVLAQQIVAMCGAEEWDEDELFDVIRRASPYRDLQRSEYEQLLSMLSEGIAAARGRYGAYLHHDQVNRKLRARRGSRMIAVTNGGAIPDNALFTVVLEPEGIVVGTLDEDFAVESSAGDIMLLGNTSWRIRRVESRGRVIVEDAHGAAPTVPFWRGEAPSRTDELSACVGELRRDISVKTPALPPGFAVNRASLDAAAARQLADTVGWLRSECGVDESGAEQLIEYMAAGRAILGEVPTGDTVIAERFFDEGGGMQLVIHAPFGARINKAWGLALRKRFCVSFNFELQAAATDNGLNISLSEQHSFPLGDVFRFLSEETVGEVLQQAVLTGSPIFGTRWRWDANRALALLRFSGGKKVPAQLQRMRADDLLAAVFPDVAACQENIEGDIRVPDHPLVHEVMKDVMHEAMDLDGLKRVLRGMNDGSIRTLAVDTPVPSQFSHEILNANPYAYLDDAPLEERRARAVEMRRSLPESVLSEIGRLDPAAIAEVRRSAWPDVRDADELQDALHSLIALPESVVFGEAMPDPAGMAYPSSPAPSQSPMLVGALQDALAHRGLTDSSSIPDLRYSWSRYFDKLLSERRATRVLVPSAGGELVFWVAAERCSLVAAIYPQAKFDSPADLNLDYAVGSSYSLSASPSALGYDDSLLVMVTGWMSHIGPVTAASLGDRLGLPAAEMEKALLRLEAAGSVLRGDFELPRAEATATGRSNTDQTAAGHIQTEWCDRRLLARIHRLTLGALRKQIEPVTAAQFMRWLFRWQHVAAGSQLTGERGALEVLRQMQGFEVPANAWERHVLSLRLANYDPRHLDQLCLTGAVGWGRLSPHPALVYSSGSSLSSSLPASASASASASISSSAENNGGPDISNSGDNNGGATTNNNIRRIVPTSVAPIAFFIREDAEWMVPRHSGGPQEISGLSPVACDVHNFLRQRGASFFADIVRGTGRLKAEVETGLWELVAGGLITADGFDNLRSLIHGGRKPANVNGAGLRAVARATRPRNTAGRWSLLYIDEPETNDGQIPDKTSALSQLARSAALEATCRMLLARYGVVFRELLARESILPKWRELQITFRRLEARGEVRGGRFVSGFIGEQFALPAAVESLRLLRNAAPTGETVTVSAADPLNLVGIIVPGDRVTAVTGNFVSFRDGVALSAEERVSALSSSSALQAVAGAGAD